MSRLDQALARIDDTLAEPAPSLAWLAGAVPALAETTHRASEGYSGPYRRPQYAGETPVAPAAPVAPRPSPVQLADNPPRCSPVAHPLIPMRRERDPYECRVDLDCGGCSCFMSAPCHHCLEHTNADGTSIDPDNLTCPTCGCDVDMDWGTARLVAHAAPTGGRCEASGEPVSVCGCN